MMSRCFEYYGGCARAGEMAGPTTSRVDLRAILPAAVLGLVVLVIIFVQLCGREHVQPLGDVTPLARATLASTFTPGPSPTVGLAEATATQAAQVGGDARDQTRQQDLTVIQQALAQYRLDHNGYPDSKGNIQTLCVFKEFDLGCKLEALLNPLPIDPLGEATTNGYWYVSDGTIYTLYAQRESDLVPECSEHPQFVKVFKSVMCVRSP
jgi:hypothetical protein